MFGYVSKWGVRFWFQNGYFKGKCGHLILRHPHPYIYIYIYILAIALFHHFVLQDAHPETVTPEPRQRVVPDVTPPAVTPYAKLQLAAAKRAENAEKNAKRSQKPVIKLNCDTFKNVCQLTKTFHVFNYQHQRAITYSLFWTCHLRMGTWRSPKRRQRRRERRSLRPLLRARPSQRKPQSQRPPSLPRSLVGKVQPPRSMEKRTMAKRRRSLPWSFLD